VKQGLRFLSAGATLLLAACASQPEAPVAAAAGLLAADRDFASDAAARGVHAAFTATMAEDGVFFRPEAVIAHAWLAENPDWSATLAWEPDRAEVSGSGDLGFTSGTWTVRPSPGGEVQEGGRYVTVWRRVRGRWQAVLDHDIELPDVTAARHPLRVSAPLHASAPGDEAAPEDAVALDVLFAASVDEGGEAVSTLLAPDVEFLRDGRTVAGREAAASALAPLDDADSGCEGAVIASDGTLSATWGTASGAGGEYTYLRVWRAANRGELPQLVLDLLASAERSG